MTQRIMKASLIANAKKYLKENRGKQGEGGCIQQFDEEEESD
jgi:hypothetical protein